MDQVHLVTIDDQNLRQVLALRTTPAQERFVAPNAVSMSQAALSPKAWFRAIYLGDEPAGFLMLEIDGDKPEYYLWRLMIATAHQRKGIGRAALDLLVAELKRWGAAELITSVVPGEGSPGPFYLRAGFQETGEVEDGEDVLRLTLDGDGAPRDHVRAAARWNQVARECEAASRHAVVAARHMLDLQTPRACAHGFATQGHLSRAARLTQELAELHAERAQV